MKQKKRTQEEVEAGIGVEGNSVRKGKRCGN
jgi:hypothetical protein